MRITYLHQYFNTPSMPGSTRSYEMARRLVAKGHEVNMITSWRESGERQGWFETEESGIKVHWLPVPYSNYLSYIERVKSFLKFAFFSAKKAASLSADVVFATSTPLTIALPGVFAAKRQKVPMVFEVRDLWPDVPIAMDILKNPVLVKLALILEKFAYNRAERIVALTPTMRDFLSGKGVPLHKIFVIPNGSDLDLFNKDSLNTAPTKELTQNKKILLYCGGIGPAHGPEYLVSLALEFLKNNSKILVLVAGEGKMSDDLKKRAEDLGCLEKTISFIGEIPHDQVPSLYAKSAASIMTMLPCELLYRHSVQNKFFDSLSAGKPVFANYAGWASEIAHREKTGFILNMDISKAASELVKFLDDESWLSSAGRAARKLAEERFSRDKLADDLEKVLLSVAGKA